MRVRLKITFPLEPKNKFFWNPIHLAKFLHFSLPILVFKEGILIPISAEKEVIDTENITEKTGGPDYLEDHPIL